MTLPPNTGLTLEDVSRLAAQLAARRGLPADPALHAEVCALAEEIVLYHALAQAQGTLEPPAGVMQGGTGPIVRSIRKF